MAHNIPYSPGGQQQSIEEASRRHRKIQHKLTLQPKRCTPCRQLSKKYGRHLGPILTHVHSAPFRQKFLVKKYLHAHAWCCLHAWLLTFRSRAMRNAWNELPISLLFRREVLMELQRFNYVQMESFSEGKDREIYFELKRISNAVHFSLDDHFHYGFKGKPLAQIVCEDMGIYPSPEMTEEEERNVRNIETYINSKIAQLKENSLSAIRSGTFKWSL